MAERHILPAFELAPMPRLPPLWKPLAFGLGLPFLLALFSGTVGGGYALILGRDGALLYVALLSFVPWWAVCLTSLAAKHLLKPWRPGLWAVTALGALLAVPLLMPFHDWVTELFRAYWPGGAQLPPRGYPHSAEHWADMAFRATRTALIWIAVNYAFAKFLAFAPYAYARPLTGLTPGQTLEPRDIDFLKRARKFTDADAVLAIKAEEHYIRLFGADGDELIHYPFSAAVAEMGRQHGLQVHRSFWVARRAIGAFNDDGGKARVTLTNNMDIPVSRRYREVIRLVLEENKRAAPLS